MGKPIRPAVLTTGDGGTAHVQARFDSGAFHSLVREDKLPSGCTIEKLKTPKSFGMADTASKLSATGVVYLEVQVENRTIGIHAFVAPRLSTDLIIGAEAMQSWDIHIRNGNGQTSIHIGHDMNDPDIQTVLTVAARRIR